MPKLFPLDNTQRLAIPTYDHKLGWLVFYGDIPEGMYGAGTVTIYDSGKYEIIKKTKTEWVVEFKGKKAKGKYSLKTIAEGRYKGNYTLKRIT